MLLLTVVAGTAVAADGGVTLADDLVDAVSDGGLPSLTEGIDTYRLWNLLD